MDQNHRRPRLLPWRLAFALVWLVNGLVCKVLDLVPRHREIVARVFGEDHAAAITVAIGLAEVAFALWILSGRHWRLTCGLQVAAVAAMNVIEFVVARDLLLFGGGNLVVATLYLVLVVRAAEWPARSGRNP